MSDDEIFFADASDPYSSSSLFVTNGTALLSRLIAAEAERPRRHDRHRRDLGEAFLTLGRIFDNVETLQLQCSVLEAEKVQAQHATDTLLQDAFDRIEDLEAVVAGLMRIVAKYDNLLSQSNGKRQEAEQRAVHAEIRVKETERGASEAVEWLYRYMADSLQVSR